jgi:ubiquitin-protein ligase
LALTISKVLISIQSLLTDPYTNVCMENDIGDLYNSNRILYEKRAKFYTWKYAMNDYIEFNLFDSNMFNRNIKLNNDD